MNKKATASLLFIIVCLGAYAQQPESRNSISLSFGPSFPIASYGNKEIKSSSTGFAQIGQALNISFSHRLNKTWGLSLTAYGQRNTYDTKAMAEEFSKQKFYGMLVYSTGFPNPVPNPNSTTYTNWNFDKDEWWIGGLMAGVNAQFPSGFSPDFFYTLKAQAGALYVVSPETKGKSITDTVIAAFSQSSAHGTGFSYSMGAGVQYKLTKKLYWISSLDFVGTNKILFKDVTNITGIVKYPNDPGMTTVSQSMTTGNAKQGVHSINFMIGIGLAL